MENIKKYIIYEPYIYIIYMCISGSVHESLGTSFLLESHYLPRTNIKTLEFLSRRQRKVAYMLQNIWLKPTHKKTALWRI